MNVTCSSNIDEDTENEEDLPEEIEDKFFDNGGFTDGYGNKKIKKLGEQNGENN